MQRPSSFGFTLIEVSIVLVIIGFLVAAVIITRSITETTRIQAQAVQLQKIASAMNAFKTKYNALPGDITATQIQNVGLTVTYGGDGNGVIDDNGGYTSIKNTYYEPMYFFMHLTAAGLMVPTYLSGTDETGTACFSPATGLPSYYSLTLNPQMGMVAFTYNNNVALFLGISDCAYSAAGTSLSPTGVLTPAQAYGIDAKIDDGIPSTGKITAETQPTSVIDGTLDTTASQCVSTSAAGAYNMSSSTLQCRLMVQIQ